MNMYKETKRYEAPKMEINLFSFEDIMTASGTGAYSSAKQKLKDELGKTAIDGIVVVNWE